MATLKGRRGRMTKRSASWLGQNPRRREYCGFGAWGRFVAGGTAPDIAGQDKANPTAVLLAFGMLLDHLDRRDCGRPVRQAIFGLIQRGECTTDLGGSLSCSAFARAVAEDVKSRF